MRHELTALIYSVGGMMEEDERAVDKWLARPISKK